MAGAASETAEHAGAAEARAPVGAGAGWGARGGLVLAVLVLGLRWAAPLAAGRAPGRADGETAAHIWGLLVGTLGLAEHGPFVRAAAAGHPAGTLRDLLDPVNLLVFGPLWAILGDERVAWAGLGLAWLGMAAAGAHALGRRLGGPRAGVLLGLAWVAAPYLHGGLLPAGRSEYWPWALWPLHLALLWDALWARDPRRRWWRGAGAAVALAALAHGGWQPLLFLLLGQVPAALLLARGAPRGRGTVLALVGLGAALLTLPMLASHLGTAPWWLDRLVGPVAGGVPEGTPLASLLGQGRVVHGDLEPFAGWVLPVLAAAAAWRAPRARPWAVLGLALLLGSLGPRIELAGAVVPGPLQLLPGSARLHGAARLAGLAALPLAVAALAVWPAGWRGGALGLLLVAEGLLWPGARGPAGVPTRPDPGLAAAVAPLPPGPIAVLWTRTDVDVAARDLLLLQLTLLDRHSSEGPNPQPPHPLGDYSVLDQPPARRSPLDHPCADEDGGRLWAAGFRSVVLVRPPGDAVQAGRSQRRRRQLTRLLGPPVVSGATHAAWILAPPTGALRCGATLGKASAPGAPPAGATSPPG